MSSPVVFRADAIVVFKREDVGNNLLVKMAEDPGQNRVKLIPKRGRRGEGKADRGAAGKRLNKSFSLELRQMPCPASLSSEKRRK
jgi:hypothetical protein